jgi:hypothetical protein
LSKSANFTLDEPAFTVRMLPRPLTQAGGWMGGDRPAEAAGTARAAGVSRGDCT